MANVAELQIQISGDSKKFDKSLNNVQKSMDGFANKSKDVGKSVSSSFKGIATSLAAFGSFALITNGLQSVINTNKNFEKSLSSLSSITGASGDDLKFFADEAKRMGATTTQSASQVAKAFEIVGSKKPELLQSKEALAEVTEQAIALAEASGMDVPQAAEALTGAMNQFGVGADQAGRFINTLAAGSKEGAAGISQISETMRVAGTVLSSANVSFEQAVALTETLAEKQITASVAGTNLRNITLKLQTDQKNYKDGIFDINYALERLSKEQLNSTRLSEMFGLENQTAAQILIENIPKVNKYTSAVTNTNTAYEQQKINTDNLQGSIDSFSSKVEALTLSFDGDGGLTYVIRKAINATGDFIDVITQLNKTRDTVDREAEAEIIKSNQIEVAQKLNDEFKKIQENGKQISRLDYGNSQIQSFLNNIKNVNDELFQKRAKLEKLERITKASSGREALEIIQERKELEKQIPVLNQKVKIYNNSIDVVDGWINKKVEEKKVVDQTTQSINKYNNSMLQVANIDFSKLESVSFTTISEAINQYEDQLSNVISKQNSFNNALYEMNAFSPPVEEIPYLSQLDMLVQKEQLTNQQRLTNYKTLQAQLVQATNLTEEQKYNLHLQYSEKIRELENNSQNERLLKMQGMLDFTGEMLNGISGLFGQFFENRLIELDNYYNRERQAIENSGRSEEQKAEAIARLDKEAAAERKKIMQKQARAEKAQAILSIALSTATAIMSALAQVPKFDFGISAAAVAATYGAIGATQMALVASQPTAFANGGIVGGTSFSGDSQLARVNSSEMILNNSQQNRLMSMLNGTSGGGMQNVVFQLEGSKLIGAIDNENRVRNNRR